MYCNKCGKEISDEALICPYCGCGTVNYVRDQAKSAVQRQPAQKKRSTALLLCIFLGGLGAHRFYVGKIWTGLLWLFTLGFGGIGTLVDFCRIYDNKFTDDAGRPLYDEYTDGMTPEEYESAVAGPRRVRKVIIVIALALCAGCFLFVRVIPDLMYALGF